MKDLSPTVTAVMTLAVDGRTRRKTNDRINDRINSTHDLNYLSRELPYIR